MMDYSKHFSPKSTTQSDPIPGREGDMSQNRAGGFAFTLDGWAQLDRFLVLGTEGGTYYASEHEVSLENAQNAVACVREDGLRVVRTLLDFRKRNRAPKMQTLLFVLAICAKMGDKTVKTAANAAVPEMCGTATHLFTFMRYANAFGGWGSGTRRAIARWYNDRDPAKLAYQVAKYRSRKGWTHRDALRVSHAVPATPEHNDVFAYVARKADADGSKPHMELLRAAEMAADATSPDEVISLIRDFGLPWECIPTGLMKSPEVNEVLLQGMPMTATIRQLGRMSAIGLLKPMSDTANTVIERVTDAEAIMKSRIHPIQVLAALSTYGSGHGARGSLTWDVNQAIVDALDIAFYAAFGNVEPTGKRTYLGIDASGSMGWGDIAGIPGLTPAKAAAALAIVTARTEALGSFHVAAFSDKMIPVAITPRQRLDTAAQKIAAVNWGGTDCALPMLDALERGLEVDTFVVYTDGETWAGSVHPSQAIKRYRKETGIPAKLVVVAMTSTGFTLADPKDAGMMDVVGFDTAAPQIISDFAKA